MAQKYVKRLSSTLLATEITHLCFCVDCNAKWRRLFMSKELGGVQRSKVDVDGGSHPMWNEDFKFDFEPSALTLQSVLITDIHKLEIDSKMVCGMPDGLGWTTMTNSIHCGHARNMLWSWFALEWISHFI